MNNKVYITTPIYYPSGKLHLGHAYTTVLGDVMKRYHASKGKRVYYLTGTDEHGQKIEEKAKEINLSPQMYTKQMAAEIQKLWNIFNISNDDFIRTSDSSEKPYNHYDAVQKIFTKLYEQGDIYKGEYEGFYCVSCETFYTKTQHKDNDGKCASCGQKINKIKEKSYFLKCSNYEKQLLEYIEKADIQPESRKKEIINSFLKEGMQDLAISRSSFKWGIPVPNDENEIIYVWIDALSNYITALGYQSNNQNLFDDYWGQGEKVNNINYTNSNTFQLVGKEIIRFHVIYWPILLMALKLPLPRHIFAHGWLIMKDEKMSKSKGNVIYPEPLIDRYGVDAVRYFLIKIMKPEKDAEFSPEEFIKIYNDDLVNDLSNLLNRTISMIQQYQNKVLYLGYDIDKNIKTECDKLHKNYYENFNTYDIQKHLKNIWALISNLNKYIDQTEPWIQYKNNNVKEVAKILETLHYGLTNIAFEIGSYMPETKEKMLKQLFYREKMGQITEDYIMNHEKIIVSDPKPLFMRIDKADIEVIKNIIRSKENKKEKENMITIDEFMQVEQVAGKIIKSEKHPNADKLLVSQIDLGDEIVQIVSGIAEYYEPETLINKVVIVVKNLKPIKLRGFESKGMILCATTDDKLELIELKFAKPGDKIK